MDKAALRARMTALRQAMSPAERENAAARIVATLLALPLPSPILAFVSVRDELPTRTLLEALVACDLTVCVPRITGRGRMEAARYDGELRPGPFGVPTTDGPVVLPELVITPGLAFDPHGGRIGYGGGYYDRWLSAHPTVPTIAVGFDAQVLERVPMTSDDVPMDSLLTDTGWRRRGSRLQALLSQAGPQI